DRPVAQRQSCGDRLGGGLLGHPENAQAQLRDRAAVVQPDGRLVHVVLPERSADGGRGRRQMEADCAAPSAPSWSSAGAGAVRIGYLADSTDRVEAEGGHAATLAAPDPSAVVRTPSHAVLTASLMLATVMQTLDTTIANVALPRMQCALSATQDEMGWVLTSYIIANAITIPLSGWLASKFDRRFVFLASVATFTVASVLCGLAQSLPQLVLLRFLQGVGGAALMPLSQAVLFDINGPKDIGRAMAIFAAAANLGPILGPVVGGWLTEIHSWRW